MNKIVQFTFTVSLTMAFLSSCNEQSIAEEEATPKMIQLPDDLSSISNTTFEPILGMLGDAKIIGVTEGTHGMNEPLDFRNELIKFLVTEKRIDVIALESGLFQSRAIHDYINGGDFEIDGALHNGLTFGFEVLPQNKTMIEWLRNYNADATNSHKVKIYGFDMAWPPSNPVIESVNYTIVEAVNYLKVVDSLSWKKYNQELSQYLKYLNFNAPPEDSTASYWSFQESEKKEVTRMIDEMKVLFNKNETMYIKNSSKEDYQWGVCAINSAKQIDDWLRHQDAEYSVREKAMFDNLDWIKKREGDKNILLFAHLAHLTKDISILNSDSVNVLKWDNFGEYLGKHYSNEFKVIGNFYRELYFPDDTIQVESGALAIKLAENKFKNFYQEVDKSDSRYKRFWNFGKPSSGGKCYMNIANGVDIIFFNDTQTYFE